MRIAVIASKVNSITSEMVKELERRGAEVRLVCPEKQLIDVSSICVQDDLYVLKSVGHLGLGIAGALHAAGAIMLNPYPIVALIKHKVAVTHILHSAGVPVPATYTSTETDELETLLQSGPLIAKPFDGARGNGIRILRTPDDLINVRFGEFLMVQRYHEPDEPGRFTKAYYLDGRVFYRKRWWTIDGPNGKESEPVSNSALLTDVVAKCARALGLRVFGLDIVISRGEPYVVDVQEFGSFAGVPCAPAMLADLIYSQSRSV
jgi:glutathione synthase/RimK-type ligase-like ATP-grasp enzyme